MFRRAAVGGVSISACRAAGASTTDAIAGVAGHGVFCSVARVHHVMMPPHSVLTVPRLPEAARARAKATRTAKNPLGAYGQVLWRSICNSDARLR
eukprot:8955659-Lingulodinium_polyedra.AAC.1